MKTSNPCNIHTMLPAFLKINFVVFESKHWENFGIFFSSVNFYYYYFNRNFFDITKLGGLKKPCMLYGF